MVQLVMFLKFHGFKMKQLKTIFYFLMNMMKKNIEKY